MFNLSLVAASLVIKALRFIWSGSLANTIRAMDHGLTVSYNPPLPERCSVQI